MNNLNTQLTHTKNSDEHGEYNEQLYLFKIMLHLKNRKKKQFSYLKNSSVDDRRIMFYINDDLYCEWCE